MTTSRFPLVPFAPDSPGWKVEVTLRASFPRIVLQYRVEGSGIENWAMTTTDKPVVRHEELWKKSCFEIFLKPSTGESYHEWNFAPDGSAYAHFSFDGYRKRIQGDSPLGARPLRMRSHAVAGSFELEVELDVGFSPGLAWHIANGRPLLVMTSAILEVMPGTSTFWALRHPQDKADFHNASCYSKIVLR